MAGSLKSAQIGMLSFLLLLTSGAWAQQTTEADVNIEGGADSGIITGSPWLWLIFIVIVIIVIVTLSSRRNS